MRTNYKDMNEDLNEMKKNPHMIRYTLRANKKRSMKEL